MTVETPQSILSRYLEGDIPASSLMEVLMPHRTEATELLVVCRPEQFSASAVARAVEDCDARVLTMSVTGMRDKSGRNVILLIVDSRTPESIQRSLERYGYEVLQPQWELSPEQQRRAGERIAELMKIIDM